MIEQAAVAGGGASAAMCGIDLIVAAMLCLSDSHSGESSIKGQVAAVSVHLLILRALLNLDHVINAQDGDGCLSRKLHHQKIHFQLEQGTERRRLQGELSQMGTPRTSMHDLKL